VPRAGLEFNHPLLCRVVAAHEGSLPKSWGLVDVSAPNVVVSSLKPAKDGGIALRVYESAGRPAAGTAVKLNADVSEANEADLLETVQGRSPVADGAVRVDLGPFQIKTLILRTKSSGAH
jgi:alpha-mannosidase